MFHVFEKINSNGIYVIAEMSANHGGSLDNALEIVRQAAKAGADCVKIQTYTADSITINCDNEFFKIHGGLWDGYKLYDLYNDAGTPYEWHKAIKDECEKCGVDFLSTPFDPKAVDFLEELGTEAYKIASFELNDIPLVEYAASKGKPMIMSCGMATLEDIKDALDALMASDFVEKYVPFGKGSRETVYKLTDPFCLFYLHFINDKTGLDEDFWQKNLNSQSINVWRGFAFENVCFNHIKQIKRALEIGGVSSKQSGWISPGDGKQTGTQIDLIIERRDNVFNMFI